MPQNISQPPRPPKRYWEDSKWARRNVQTLSTSYPNEWIAVFRQAVVVHDSSLETVLDAVAAKAITSPVIKYIEKGIHVYQYLVENSDQL